MNIREVFNKCCSFLLFIHQKILQNITDSPKKVLKKCISCTAVCNIAKITIFEFLEDHVRLRTGEMADENVSLLFFKTKTIVQPELQRSLSTLFKSYLSIRNNIHGAVHFKFYCWFSFCEFRELFFFRFQDLPHSFSLSCPEALQIWRPSEQTFFKRDFGTTLICSWNCNQIKQNIK